MITFIGDVHGWLDRLESILQQEPNGAYLFLGDLIDRGPDSKAVVNKVQALCSSGKARCIIGNHEYALVRSLGCPELNIAAEPKLYDTWLNMYGGMETCLSYGVIDGDRAKLRIALGDDLVWMAKLPWIISDQIKTPDSNWNYLAVHAGLRNEIPWQEQCNNLLDSEKCWNSQQSSTLYDCLFSKGLIHTKPFDLPDQTIVVSGHTRLNRVFTSAGRIVCDTCGGHADLPLSAIRWPSGEIYCSE